MDDPKAQTVPDILHGAREIGIVGNDDSLLIVAIEAIHKETSGQINVRTFLLRVQNPHLTWQTLRWLGQLTPPNPGAENAVVNFKAGKGSQSAQVHKLATRLIWITGACVQQGSKVADLANFITREEVVCKLLDVQPLEGSASDCSIVEIQAVDVYVRFQLLFITKTETAFVGGLDPTSEVDRGGGIRKITSEKLPVNGC